MSNVRVLGDAPWLKSGPTARVLELLNGNGEEARVIGGAVRNALLKIPVGDIDIATTALPDEVIRAAHLTPCHDISATVNERLAKLGPEARVAVLPQGPLTIPYLA